MFHGNTQRLFIWGTMADLLDINPDPNPQQEDTKPLLTDKGTGEEDEDNPCVKLPDWLKEVDVITTVGRLETEFTNWFKDALQRIEDKYKLYENKQGFAITNPEGPIIPLFYSVMETLKSRLMSSAFAQEQLFDMLPEGVESLAKPKMVPNPRFKPPVVPTPNFGDSLATPPPPGPPPPPPGPPPKKGNPAGGPQPKPMPLPPPPEPPMIPDPTFQSAADVASIMKDFLGEAIYDTPDFFQRMDVLVQSLLLENVMIARLCWEQYDQAQLETVDEKDITGKEETTKAGVQKKTKGCPSFKPRSVRGFAWDPRAEFNMDQASWCRDRTMVRMDELLGFQAQGLIQNVESIEGIGTIDQTVNSVTEPNKDPQARQARNVEGINLPTGSWDADLVQLDEYWAEITGKDKDGELHSGDFQFWVANGKTLLRFDVNDPSYKKLRRPFAMGVVNQKPGQLLGIGPLDIIMALIKDIANVLQAKKKLIWQTANSPIFYEPVSMLDGKRTLLEGANLVPVLSSKNINRFPPPVEAINALDRHLQFLISMVREATASNEQAQGIQGGATETATEARILAASAGQRMQYLNNMVNASFFTQLGDGYLELFKQCGLEGDMVTREAGVDGEPIAITYKMLEMRFKIRPVSAVPQANKMSRFNLLQGLVVNLLKLPPGALVNDQGQAMQVNTYDFMTQDILPLIDVRGGQRLFRVMGPMPPPQANEAEFNQMAQAPEPVTPMMVTEGAGNPASMGVTD